MKLLIRIISALIIIIYLCSLTGCAKNSQSKIKDEKSENPSVPVEVTYVTAGDISAYFSGTATIEAEEETEVVAKVAGVVEKIFVEEGDVITKNQTLAKLDDEIIAVQLEQAQANLKKLEDNYTRNDELYQKKLVSTEEYQRVKYEYEHQKATYNLAKLELDYTSIKSPISGVVAERLIKVGNMILANQATFKVTGLETLIAILYVPERQLSKLRTDLKARLQVDAIAGKEFTGHVKRISPVVDRTTGTIKVTIAMNDPSRQLRPGMFARISIIYDVHENTMLVPKDAVIAEDNASSVFVVQDSLSFRKNIEVGYINTTHIEVLKGLRVGDNVVTTGKSSLKDSTKVEIVAN
jgi:membrane fusion protein (multidrug efflux system)